jgi:hypothetical protein
LIGFSDVLKQGQWRLGDYLNAVKYVSYKMMGYTHKDSFIRVFPKRWERLLQKDPEKKNLAMYVQAYHRTRLVTRLLEMAVVPSWLLNQDLYQKALNVQAEIMLTARSEIARTNAANSLLQHLKMPETAKVELDVNVKEDQSINELRQATLALARRQREMIASGAMNARDVAEQKVITGERVREEG